MPRLPSSELSTLLRYLLQYAKFGAVGLTATGTHVVIFTILIEIFSVNPLISNFFSFSFAVVISYLGNFHWTFRTNLQNSPKRAGYARRAFPKFFLVAVVGLTLNSLSVYCIVDILHLPYQFSFIFMILIVPAVVFGLMKFWVFE